MMTFTLPADASAILDAAIAREAAGIASARLYNAQDAASVFGITRSALKHLPRTMLPGRTKPLYSARAVADYLASREISPETKPRKLTK